MSRCPKLGLRISGSPYLGSERRRSYVVVCAGDELMQYAQCKYDESNGITPVPLDVPLSSSGLLMRVTEQETERRSRKRSFWTELVTDGHGLASKDSADDAQAPKEFKFAFGFDSE
jgi:hypothetical protein